MRVAVDQSLDLARDKGGEVNRQNGMTLTEMIVVIGVIGLLIVGLTTYATSARRKAKIAKAKNELRYYGTAVQQYHNAHAMDATLNTRWPTDVTSGQGGCGNLTPVPSELINEGYWKEGSCQNYDYENWVGRVGSEDIRVIGVTWYGLDNKRGNRGVSKGDLADNILLLVSGTKTQESKLAGKSLADKYYKDENFLFMN